MKNVTFGIALTLMAASLLSVSISAQPSEARWFKHPMGVNARQARQQRRVGQGLQSGQLTGREARNIEKREGRLAKQEYRFRHDGDPGLQPNERRRLEREQNHLSNDIYRQKHDGQTQ